MGGGKGLNTLGRCYYAHKLYALRIEFLDFRYRVNSASAGGEHRVKHENITLVKVGGQLAVIINRSMGFGVAVHAYVTDTGGGNKA